MVKVCKVCGEEIESFDVLVEWVIDVYKGGKNVYCFHKGCLSGVSIDGLK